MQLFVLYLRLVYSIYLFYNYFCYVQQNLPTSNMLKNGHLLIADILVWSGRSPQKTLKSSQKGDKNSGKLSIRGTKSWPLTAISIENYLTIAGTLARYENYIKCI